MFTFIYSPIGIGKYLNNPIAISVFFIIAALSFASAFFRVATLEVLDGKIIYKTYSRWGCHRIQNMIIPVSVVRELLIRGRLIISTPRGKEIAYFLQLATSQGVINIGNIYYFRHQNIIHFRDQLAYALESRTSEFFHLAFPNWLQAFLACFASTVCGLLIWFSYMCS